MTWVVTPGAANSGGKVIIIGILLLYLHRCFWSVYTFCYWRTKKKGSKHTKKTNEQTSKSKLSTLGQDRYGT